MATTIKEMTEIILKNELYILPLYSIKEGGMCSCDKADCSAPGKHPLFRYNWKIIASNKADKVLNWLEAYNKMNFGLATGRLSKVTNKYLIVIDVDESDHPLIKTLPNTFSYRTGSGGYHFWFWSKYPIKNSVSFLANKVDIRGTDGYVVIPPSKHYKGLYNNINNAEIADLPKPILSKLLEKPIVLKPSTKPKKKSTPSVASIWASEPVPVIRDMMQTQLVPEGVRNVVMHRLLSSDRAKGSLKHNLETNARIYLKRFENPETFRNELATIINSALTYPAYNNNYQKVNEHYIAWLKKNYKNKIPPKDLLATLDMLDNEFFGLLTALPRSVNGRSLEEILEARKAYMRSKGHVDFVSNYKPQLLAKKLISLGFTKTRTAKRNIWNVVLPQEIR
jgi:hypothetical protein